MARSTEVGTCHRGDEAHDSQQAANCLYSYNCKHAFEAAWPPRALQSCILQRPRAQQAPCQGRPRDELGGAGGGAHWWNYRRDRTRPSAQRPLVTS